MTQPNSSDHGDRLTIGLRDLYDQMQTMSAGYNLLSSKLDTALLSFTLGQQSIAQQIAQLREDQNDHEMRIRAQEGKQTISPKAVWAGVSVIVGLLSFLFTIVQVILK